MPQGLQLHLQDRIKVIKSSVSKDCSNSCASSIALCRKKKLLNIISLMLPWFHRHHISITRRIARVLSNLGHLGQNRSLNFQFSKSYWGNATNTNWTKNWNFRRNLAKRTPIITIKKVPKMSECHWLAWTSPCQMETKKISWYIETTT